MKTISINLYSFDELSEAAKQKAIEKLSDINVNYEWWDSIYDDAKTIGLNITGFDMDRYCNGDFTTSAPEVAELILKNHGETCETYKTAKEYLKEHGELVEKYSDGVNKNKVSEENEYDYDNEADEQDEEFKKSLLEDYRIMLRNECEYLQSEESIIETIKANEYMFTENGQLS